MGSQIAYSRKKTTLLFICIFFFAIVTTAINVEKSHVPKTYDPVYRTKIQEVFHPIAPQQQPNEVPTNNAPDYDPTTVSTFHSLHSALFNLQVQYFSLWLGKWTTAIDWTAAVMNTHLTATLSSFSHSLAHEYVGTFDESRVLDVEARTLENEINKYFAQGTAFYFGEEYFAIRTQAFDDMLWVVLEWLDSIQFIRSHAERHYTSAHTVSDGTRKVDWHGQQFIPVFVHRARVFYELAEQGWDWALCGGGMTWNPRFLPYKNAITNQLFISASVSMYLHFPGDDNCSPFLGAQKQNHPAQKEMHAKEDCSDRSSTSSTYDPIYLVAAQNGYDWLVHSNMTNEQGLYTDGFHISGYAQNHSRTECDERNEMVYTYNQGVILSGLRGLWEATGNVTYLEHGHDLVRNVIKATGWKQRHTSTERSKSQVEKEHLPHADSQRQPRLLEEGWTGLGAHGILTELCDPSGTCSQDGQTFKGIFFHHLTAFCTLLPTTTVQPGRTHAADRLLANLHKSSCSEYTAWVAHNAKAALKTRDGEGRFGMWWGAGDTGSTSPSSATDGKLLPRGAEDYRNDAFRSEDTNSDTSAFEKRVDGDLNDRGRGRTVETQGGGVAVVRALYEFQRRFGSADDL